MSTFTGHFIDIMATFVELTGAEYPAEYAGKKVLSYEGVSLMPVVRNEKAERTKPICWEWANGQAIRDGRWKLVRHGLNNKWSLFDMYDDPAEVNDVAEKNPQKVEKMVIMFQEWQKRVMYSLYSLW